MIFFRVPVIILAALLLFVPGCKLTDPVVELFNPAETQLVELSVTTISVPEPSGLFYNTLTNTLFTVSDKNSTVYELSVSGDILDSIKLSGSDFEGITFSKNMDSMYVVEETSYRVSCFSTSGRKLYSWSIVTSLNPTHAYEGITINAENDIVILNEKNPMLVIVADKTGNEKMRFQTLFTTDISDICYDAYENCYWMISAESKKILKLRPDFSVLASWDINSEKGEGIAVTKDKIYVVSDSDSGFIVYRKPRFPSK